MGNRIFALREGSYYLSDTSIDEHSGKQLAHFTNDVNLCKLMDDDEISEHLTLFPSLQVRIINTL